MIKCLFVKAVKHCKIYVGCVSGASFINEATNCEIHVQSHQIRIHHTTQTSFYLTAKSNPIIEHCSELGFGPFATASDEPVF